MENYIISLSDGSEIAANLNGSIWETSTEISDETFNNKTNNVSYTTPDGDVVELGECETVILGYIKNRKIWQFVISPISREYKIFREIQDAISDVSDAILEMSEIVYGEE